MVDTYVVHVSHAWLIYVAHVNHMVDSVIDWLWIRYEDVHFLTAVL